jgi:glycosyltransferase involved in cell wall biosynthesis
MAKVSIILPSYNHEKFLKKRLDSILNQTLSNWELIIIDDCSTDSSINILNKFVIQNNDRVTQFIINNYNSGSGYNSWKKGIKLAKSEYIWIAETDDYSSPEFLEEQIKILDNNKNVNLSFSASNYIDEKGDFLYNTDRRTHDLNVQEGYYGIFNFSHFTDKMPLNTYITNGSCVVFRRPKNELPENIFIYKQMSDQFLWTHLLQNGNFAFLNKKLNYFRRHETSTTQKNVMDNSGGLYIETVDYLNFFKFDYKYKTLLKHYIKYFVWCNKQNLFRTKIIQNIDGVSNIKLKYYTALFKFLVTKIFIGNAKK